MNRPSFDPTTWWSAAGSCHPKPIPAGRVVILPFQNPINLTRPWYIICSAQGSQFSHSFSVLRLSLTLLISQHLWYVPIHTDISTSLSFQPPPSLIYIELSTSIIANLHWSLNLHHRWSTSSSWPPSSPICTDLSTSIITDLRFSSIHHHCFAISVIHHLQSASQGCSFH